MHLHLMSTFITNPFYIPGQTIPTHHPPSMNRKFYLISLLSHFYNQPFHVHYMPRIYRTLSFTIHTPSQSCIFIHLMPSYNNTIKCMPSIQEQGKTSNRDALSPISSLKLKGLAQAKGSLAQARGSLTQAGSLRLGESSTYKYSGLCAFSLRRDSPRLSETLARSKTELVA